jgi:type II secretory pathway component PulF
MSNMGDKYFSKLEINLMRAGEIGGVLDVVLSRTANYLKGKVKSNFINVINF